MTSGVLAQTPAAWTGFVIGSVNSSTLKGDVPEIIIYDRVLTATERGNVESYLEAKYGCMAYYPGLISFNDYHR